MRAAMIPDTARLKRERQTVRHMVRIYCSAHHDHPELCSSCSDLLSYAMDRLDHCVFKPDKPTCKICPVHCYKPQMRSRMRQVMTYSGPLMLLTHPILAIRHLLDERRPPPAHLPRRAST
jgi:predicted amidophosphoribosyltransferase